MKQLVLILVMMLCMSQAALPACAADYALGIFGNANMDDTIDEKDVAYVEGVIKGINAATNLSDANYDGKTDAKDIDQIKLMMRGEEKNLTIVDGANRVVTVKKPLKRIVVTTTASGVAMQILKATDNVVGRSDHGLLSEPNCFPELSKLPLVGSKLVGGSSQPDFEAILGLNPDAILVYSWQDRYKNYVENLPGIPVLAFDFMSDETMRKEFETLGYILDKEDEARKYLEFYESTVQMMKERTKGLSDDKKPRVYFGTSHDFGFYRTMTAKDPVLNPMIDIAGGVNIAANLTAGKSGSGFSVLYPEVDAEWVISQNPDIIAICAAWLNLKAGGYNSTDDPSILTDEIKYVKSIPELANLAAVKDNKIYAIHGAISSGYGPGGLLVGGAYLAKWFHPELFKDLDPQAIHQKYLDFRGLDYDVYKHGAFAYPEPS
jgi:iron complex transport system substrate-binding protein